MLQVAMSLCSVQIVNFASEAQHVDVEVLGLESSPETMTVHLLNSTDGLAENSFDEPFAVKPSGLPHPIISLDCLYNGWV